MENDLVLSGGEIANGVSSLPLRIPVKSWKKKYCPCSHALKGFDQQLCYTVAEATQNVWITISYFTQHTIDYYKYIF